VAIRSKHALNGRMLKRGNKSEIECSRFTSYPWLFEPFMVQIDSPKLVKKCEEDFAESPQLINDNRVEENPLLLGPEV
jgi:hypothetical protein